MLALFTLPTITRLDAWAAIGLALFVTFAIKACRVHLPDPVILQGYATIANTPGGLILILTFLWLLSLSVMVAVCLWVIEKGIDPSNGTLVLLTGMLSSSAFGGVSGVLFSTMTGQPPPAPPGTSSTTTTT